MTGYSFADIIKASFLKEIDTISVSSLMTTLLLAFLLGVFIVAVYRLTYNGVMFSWNFALCLLLLSIVTAVIILVISSNVVLSLGMVGALSIVRFRTAVKDPVDTVFMFWAIAAGIITGAGYISISLIATGAIGVMFIAVAALRMFFTSRAYMVVLRCAPGSNTQRILNNLPHYRIRSESLSEGIKEVVLETRLNGKRLADVEKLREREDIVKVDIISYNGDTML